jgi:hypothetical protein
MRTSSALTGVSTLTAFAAPTYLSLDQPTIKQQERSHTATAAQCLQQQRRQLHPAERPVISLRGSGHINRKIRAGAAISKLAKKIEIGKMAKSKLAKWQNRNWQNLNHRISRQRHEIRTLTRYK